MRATRGLTTDPFRLSRLYLKSLEAVQSTRVAQPTWLIHLHLILQNSRLLPLGLNLNIN
jgi:hypothetical protein